MLKSLVLLLANTALLLAQNPLLSGDNPSMMLGTQKYNIGSVRVVSGSGAPATVNAPNATALTGGDFYIDNANHVTYQCDNFAGPCTAVGTGNWVLQATPSVVSVSAFGVNGSGTDATNLQTALSAAAGHYCLYFPSTFTTNLSGGVHVSVPSNSCITGDGPAASKIAASGLTTPGFGVFDIPLNSSNITIEKIGVDGGVISSTGISYTTAQSATPAGAIFTTGSTFWVHSNAFNIVFRDVQVDHTGGYAYYWDATQGPSSRIRMYRTTIQNSRPHLFGNPSPTIYGSWTGGVLFEQGTNITYGFTDVVVEGGIWQNVVGNCLWFSRQSSSPQIQSYSVRFSGNTFTDVGLDAIQVNGIDGYVETNNKVLRFGYVIISDVGTTRSGGPLWLQGFVPVAFDSFAPVVNFTRNGNWAEGNGQMFDLDGSSSGVVANNTHQSCFNTIDPLADITHCGPSVAIGQNFDRFVATNNSTGVNQWNPYFITFTGNTVNNVGNGAFILFGCQNCVVSGNTIYASSVTSNPIVLGNLSTSVHATFNTVTGNVINWVPTSGAAAVFEDGVTACSCPFNSSDANYVRNNSLEPQPAPSVTNPMFEFQKAAGSASGTGALTLSSVTPGAPGNDYGSILQTEGTSDPILNFYVKRAGTGQRAFTIATTGMIPSKVLWSQLPLISGPGQIVYCTDCTQGTSPCTSGGTGALAVTNASQWVCQGTGGGGGGGITGSGTTAQLATFTGTTAIGNAGMSVSGGVLNVPSGIVSSSGIQASGFNPTGFTGSTVTVQIGCAISGGNCTSVYYAVPGGGSLPCPAGGASNCTYYSSMDVTGGIVRGTH